MSCTKGIRNRVSLTFVAGHAARSVGAERNIETREMVLAKQVSSASCVTFSRTPEAHPAPFLPQIIVAKESARPAICGYDAADSKGRYRGNS